MSDRTGLSESGMTRRQRLSYYLLTVLVGIAVSIFVSPIVLGTWIRLGWRRPIQEFMIAYGASRWIGPVGIFYLQIPDYAMAAIGGCMIGLVAWRRWLRFSFLYSITLFGIPFVIYSLFRSSWMLYFLNFSVIPIVLTCAWVASRPQRHRALLKENNLCWECAYNLTGNTSGVCPECGTKVQL